jgi:molecular chaperone DnaK
LQSKRGVPFSLDQTVSKDQLEALIGGLVRSTQTQIDTALSDAHLSGPGDIDEVLLVGGSTKIPLVSKFLTEIFNKAPKRLVDPDLAVVRGAAAQAAIIAGELAGELAITDICPFTLGTSYYDILLDRHVFHPLIKKNTVIPVTKTDTFLTVRDFQTKVESKVYEGEYSNPDNNQLLGDMMLEGIPPARAGAEPLACTFAYDINGI